METENFKIIARIYTDFPEKFGLPRQSGIVKGLKGKIVFEPEYRDFSALRGLEEFSHLWVLWLFSGFDNGECWSPTVRPPRLGGNKRVGVFATRSPNRPNPIALSALKIDRIYNDKDLGPVIEVSGIDMTSGTAIVDIKPYLPFADIKEGAVGGFADPLNGDALEVNIPEKLTENLSAEFIEELYEVLSGDPRPRYHNDPEREYGFTFKNYEIKFKVAEEILNVTDIKVK